MVRQARFLSGVAACVVVCAAGCGSSGSKSVSGALPQVTGAVGQRASITLPTGAPVPTKLETSVLVQGSGASLSGGELVAVDYTVMNWSSSKMLGDTYSRDGGKTPNQPQVVTLGSGSLLPAWNSALSGARVGSRIEVVAPPSEAFGGHGNTQYGVGPNDVLVFVLDVVGAYAPNADITGTQGVQSDPSLPKVAGNPGGNPSVTIPVGQRPPANLVADTLIHGTGETVESGKTLILQYSGWDWNTAANFDASYTRGQVFSTVIGAGKVIKGWDQGLVGKHVGDRVLLVIPPALGYGPSGGQKAAGIGADDTLVFVVDIVDAV